ncbi:hypothetical protein AMD27_14395 [Acinetobacter sp. TGL-Y2]|uniref:hypothetical protein n=1 Tax=Acinetobacter sp. TGL-Y2 TaxID=1407071 RepID=UPI0007A66B64|nr:hypothetical protein [Acinetobacter sp. TGL-Y2]AMW79972.1 hypothetical protein AMD27_14395 [Acinetobacter sp. TGL-Y2]
MSYKIMLISFFLNFGLIACGNKSYSEEDITPDDIFYKMQDNKSCLYIEKKINESDVEIRSISIAEKYLDKKFLYQKISEGQRLTDQSCINFSNSLDALKNKMKKGENYYFSIQTNYTNISFFQCFEFDGKNLDRCENN